MLFDCNDVYEIGDPGLLVLDVCK